MSTCATCATCAHWTSRRPNAEQEEKLRSEYERLSAAAGAKRQERDALQDTMRAERPATPPGPRPGATPEKPWGWEWNDAVWFSPPVQRLHREREALAEASYRVRDLLSPSNRGMCRVDGPRRDVHHVNLGIFGIESETRQGWPTTTVDDTCARYLFKDGQ